MSLISYLFGRRGNGTDAPWTEASIFRLIASKVDPHTERLPVDHLELPDEASVRGDSAIGWAAGAMDGVAAFHVGKSDEKATARRVALLVDEFARTGARNALSALYGLLKDDAVVGFIDEVFRLIADTQTPIQPHLPGLAVKLATQSADRGPVKFGIALIGVLGLREHENVVLTLGKHDEFTLFASVALSNMLDDATPTLWRLARSVDGWGRIQTVERLVPTTNPEIQRWLRTEGFRNSVMYEYLAHAAAVHGRLRDALSAEFVEPAELLAAGEIIQALITGNGAPAEGIDAYDDAAETCRAYLAHARLQPRHLTHFLTAQLLLGYLRGDEREQAERLKNGWSEAAQSSVQNLASQLIGDPQWQAVALQQLRSKEAQAFYDACRAAEFLGIDLFDEHWNRLVADPGDGGHWFNAMRTAGHARIDRVIAFAEATLPLRAISTGPEEQLGFGPEYKSHSCLDFVLQDLKSHPGKGWRLIETGLHSPVIRNRHMALNALEAWAHDDRPPQWTELLRGALAREPNTDVRQRMSALLSSAH